MESGSTRPKNSMGSGSAPPGHFKTYAPDRPERSSPIQMLKPFPNFDRCRTSHGYFSDFYSFMDALDRDNPDTSDWTLFACHPLHSTCVSSD